MLFLSVAYQLVARLLTAWFEYGKNVSALLPRKLAPCSALSPSTRRGGAPRVRIRLGSMASTVRRQRRATGCNFRGCRALRLLRSSGAHKGIACSRERSCRGRRRLLGGLAPGDSKVNAESAPQVEGRASTAISNMHCNNSTFCCNIRCTSGTCGAFSCAVQSAYDIHFPPNR